MATLEQIQEIANRGIQDQLSPERRIKFDELVTRGIVTLPGEPDILDPTPATSPVPEEEGGFVDLFAEPAKTFITGAIAEPVAGVAGIVQPVNPFTSAKTPTQAVEQTREAITSLPQTRQGKIGLQSVAEFPPVKAFIDGLLASEKFLGDIGFNIAGPAGGAFGASIPTAILEGLGLVSLKNLRLGKANLIDNSGKPVPELQNALDKANVKFEDLPAQAKTELVGARAGLNIEEAARRGRFQEQGIPFTKGDVSQQFKKVADEQRLLTMVGDEASEPLRQLKLAQSQAFIKNTDALVDSLGGTEDAGNVLKGALEGRLDLLKQEKNALYKEFAETSPEIARIPVITKSLEEAIPDPQSVRRINRLVPGPGNALDDLLVEFGVDKDTAKVDAFLKAGENITPLDIGNFEDFRQAINQIERADQSNAIKVITGPIKKALDNEGAIIDQSVKAAGITDESVFKPLKEARETVRTIKTEFSPESITGKLIGVKKDGVTPVIEASKAVDKVIGKNIPIENLQRTVDSLNQSKGGVQAIKGLQASVVLKALDNALKASTVKTGGIQTITPNQFVKSLNDFGADRLDVLFANNKPALKRLLALKKTARDITPPAATVPKGSAPIILDAIKRVSSLPIVGAVTQTINFIVNAGSDTRKIRKAIQAKPSFKKSVKFIKDDFPTLAVALGIGTISTKNGE